MKTTDKSFAQRHADLLALAQYVIQAATAHKLRHDPWYRLKIKTALGEDLDPTPTMIEQVMRFESRMMTLYDKSTRIRRAITGSGMQCQGKVAMVLAQIWQEIEADGYAQGGEHVLQGVDFVRWLNEEFHFHLFPNRFEHELMQEVRLMTSCDEQAERPVDEPLIATYSQQAPNPVPARKNDALMKALFKQSTLSDPLPAQAAPKETRQQRRARQRAEEKALKKQAKHATEQPVSLSA